MKRALIRVLVVEDFEPFQNFICSRLETNPRLQVICKAQDGADAVRQARELQPDLIVIDIGLPKIHGIEAIRQLREHACESIVLFVSQNLDPEVVQRAFEVGGKGYVLKAHAGTDLLAAVDAVLRGRRFVSGALREHGFTDLGATASHSGRQRLRSLQKSTGDPRLPEPVTI